MKVEFRNSFAKDLKSIRDKALLKRVRELIGEVEHAKTFTEISNLKKVAAITIVLGSETIAWALRSKMTASSLFGA